MSLLSPPAPPAPAVRRDAFVDEARAFAARYRGELPFRYLLRYVAGSEDELDLLICKLHCDAHPLNYGARKESLAVSLWKLAALPLYQLLQRGLWLWREARVDFDIETVDPPYFERWYRPIYDRLPGSKRITPSSVKGAEGWSEPINKGLTLRTFALMLLAPVWIPSLWRISRESGRNIAASFRLTLGLFAGFEAHFFRYPCRRYLAYNDDHNHPSRLLAFRYHGGERFAVVQNGERTLHPVYAFGAMDDYLCFGDAMKRLAPALGMRVNRVIPVGALYLNGRLSELKSLADEPKEFDLIFVDQLVWPYNDFDETTGLEFERCFDWLDALKAARPHLRVGYQLRHYPDRSRRDEIVRRVSARFKHDIEFLENAGHGESYRNAARARIVCSFQSTFAYEAFFLGRGTKALYVNPTRNPFEHYCDDERFQLHAPDGDPAPFVAKVDELLELRLSAPPECARERHAYTDGRAGERIAEALRS